VIELCHRTRNCARSGISGRQSPFSGKRRKAPSFPSGQALCQGTWRSDAISMPGRTIDVMRLSLSSLLGRKRAFAQTCFVEWPRAPPIHRCSLLEANEAVKQFAFDRLSRLFEITFCAVRELIGKVISYLFNPSRSPIGPIPPMRKQKCRILWQLILGRVVSPAAAIPPRNQSPASGP
jgi:hypothetical protein